MWLNLCVMNIKQQPREYLSNSDSLYEEFNHAINSAKK